MTWQARPGKNELDACCRCAKLIKTAADHLNPGPDELGVWQPTPSDPPQWICDACRKELTDAA